MSLRSQSETKFQNLNQIPTWISEILNGRGQRPFSSLQVFVFVFFVLLSFSLCVRASGTRVCTVLPFWKLKVYIKLCMVDIRFSMVALRWVFTPPWFDELTSDSASKTFYSRFTFRKAVFSLFIYFKPSLAYFNPRFCCPIGFVSDISSKGLLNSEDIDGKTCLYLAVENAHVKVGAKDHAL